MIPLMDIVLCITSPFRWRPYVLWLLLRDKVRIRIDSLESLLRMEVNFRLVLQMPSLVDLNACVLLYFFGYLDLLFGQQKVISGRDQVIFRLLSSCGYQPLHLLSLTFHESLDLLIGDFYFLLKFLLY